MMNWIRVIGFQVFVILTLAHGQTLQIINNEIHQVPLKKKQEYRTLSLSPDGRFLSFEALWNKNYFLYIYDIQSGQLVHIGEPYDSKTSSSESLFQPVRKLKGNQITNKLCWTAYEDMILFDFIHSPRQGKFILYSSIIPTSERQPLSPFHNQKIEGSGIYESFFSENEYTYIDYPILSHHPYNEAFLVALTVHNRIYLYLQGSGEKPIPITQPGNASADIGAKFSPDDRQIAFIRDSRDDSNIGLLTRTGKNWQQWKEEILVSSPYIETSPEWSEDGTMLAYYSDKDHSKEFSLWVYDFKTNSHKEIVRNIVRNSERHKGPNWVGNQGFIYVKLDLKENNPLYYTDLKRGYTTRIHTNKSGHQDIAIVKVGENRFRVAFTARGELQSEDNLIWTKVYYMDIQVF
ncbi:MAG: hypothetical protein D6813_13210 [Calditrichaeota bacterium]|nr:MAG: hypothetical protein D6813_13210 [Calditrichota bacterium]